MNSKRDIFVQKYMRRLFALNVILVGQYASLNVMYTDYKFESNVLFVHHIGVQR